MDFHLRRTMYKKKLDLLVQWHQKNNSLGFNKERANNTKLFELHM